jgi:tetratricopeptide (TPR) repeat protein
MTDKGAELAHQASVYHARDSYAHQVQGECELALRHCDIAIAAQTAAISVKPSNYDARFFRARAYMQARQWEKAVADYTAYIAASAKGTSPTFANYLSFAYLERSLAYNCERKGDPAARDAQQYLVLNGWDHTPSGTAILFAWLGFNSAKRDVAAARILSQGEAFLPTNVWPSPIVSCLRHSISEQDLMQFARNDQQLTDAHAWLGLDNEMRLTGKAQDEYSWVKQHGVQGSYSYLLVASRSGS